MPCAEECSGARSPAAEDTHAHSALDPAEDALEDAHSLSLLQATHRLREVKAIERKEHFAIENTNLVYIRVPKTGSTVCSGVNRNIAAHHNLTGVDTECVWIAQNGEPGAWSDHMTPSHDQGSPVVSYAQQCERKSSGFTKDSLMEDVKALQLPTFMWTMVRDPAERAMSHCYWEMAPKAPTTAEKLQCLAQEKNTQFNYIRPFLNSTLEEVLNTYNFLGVNEYFDESMVGLAAALRIPLTDVLYIVAKNNSAGTREYNGKLAVAHPPLEEEPEVVKQFLNGTFRQANSLDYQLYEHANRTLSALVATMTLDEAIVNYKSVLSQVQQACDPGNSSVYLSTVADCYTRDQGCNYRCIDEQSTGLFECKWCK